MIDIYNDEYFEILLGHSNLEVTDERINVLKQVIADIETSRSFGRKNPASTANSQLKQEEKADRLRLELIEVYSQMGLGTSEWELMQKLKDIGKIKVIRNEALYTKIIKSFENDLLDMGLKKDDINKNYTPALKRFLKKEQNDPFNIGYSLYI